jgi:predicted DNA-binding protein
VNEPQETDPEQLVRYALSWPAWMAERVTKVARTRTMPVAVWVREAIWEKLERTEEGDRP